jgi:hypothetical protein
MSPPGCPVGLSASILSKCSCLVWHLAVSGHSPEVPGDLKKWLPHSLGGLQIVSPVHGSSNVKERLVCASGLDASWGVGYNPLERPHRHGL